MRFNCVFYLVIIVCCGSNFLTLLLFLVSHISYRIICIIVKVSLVICLLEFCALCVSRCPCGVLVFLVSLVSISS